MPPTRTTHERATLGVNREGIETAMQAVGISGPGALALHIGVDRSTVFRVLGGHTAPGEEFIARTLAAFPHAKFEDLFRVQP